MYNPFNGVGLRHQNGKENFGIIAKDEPLTGVGDVVCFFRYLAWYWAFRTYCEVETTLSARYEEAKRRHGSKEREEATVSFLYGQGHIQDYVGCRDRVVVGFDEFFEFDEADNPVRIKEGMEGVCASTKSLCRFFGFNIAQAENKDCQRWQQGNEFYEAFSRIDEAMCARANCGDLEGAVIIVKGEEGLAELRNSVSRHRAEKAARKAEYFERRDQRFDQRRLIGPQRYGYYDRRPYYEDRRYNGDGTNNSPDEKRQEIWIERPRMDKNAGENP